MKRKSFLSSVVVAGLVLFMVATTSISFAYWKSGVEGNNANKVLNVTIGEGSSYETTVNLTDVSKTPEGKRLVPIGRVEDTSTQTDEISFVVNVKWNAVGDVTSHFEGTLGYLKVTCTSITIDQSENEFLNAKGYGGYDLFIITTDQASYDIHGDDTVAVTVIVKMNEPLNRAQYEEIVGQNLNITLDFKISSPDDLNQQIG